ASSLAICLVGCPALDAAARSDFSLATAELNALTSAACNPAIDDLSTVAVTFAAPPDFPDTCLAIAACATARACSSAVSLDHSAFFGVAADPDDSSLLIA